MFFFRHLRFGRWMRWSAFFKWKNAWKFHLDAFLKMLWQMETDPRFRCWACGSLCISKIPTANGSVHSATCCQHRPSSSCMTQHSKLYKNTTPKKYTRLLALFLFFFHHPIIAANRFLFAESLSPKDSRIIHWGMANTESSPRHVLYLKLGWQHL